MAKLTDPITILKGVGPAKAKQFQTLGIYTLQDLICHFPRGYEDRTKLVTIEKLEVDVPACFKAMVMNTPALPISARVWILPGCRWRTTPPG